ncbi:MAG TPA: AmmeMemoRadiSam system protein B [candidate division Zixibacteria bacterium]|nr:AmmeMemoRadiSam system protein B [candidate division Zixibacteria bacterium]MDD4917554.1 AmmeMemoRadiSam system protein B [candidate division Zixibacteria bacterium]MDM7972177.1 AmmeMemoRadiSam system protein B [candidate division Zixibacteria bacterium]HOD66473.1 AmmeMemoRadiSam system protein B [candidate division Zixibacteria bacterium]HOZ06753.1 AmmeMemoRadiSam system protein B [candidate division Zixibacteria bacterium]
METDRATIRKPAVAGAFYPRDPGELATAIARLYAQAGKRIITGHPVVVVAPHAGYPYSGLTAAKAYKQLEGEQFDTVVVISPSHTVFFKGSSVFAGAGYETPLGVVETDRPLADRIAAINPSNVYYSNMGHATGSTRGEHALEVQLPFLQVMLGRFKLVAIVMGDQEEESVRILGETLAAALKGANALMVASSDLSHFHNAKVASRLDGTVRQAVEQFDEAFLLETLETGKGEACGGGPIAAAIIAGRRLGATRAQVIDYSHSGQTTGDFNEVVGYLSAVFLSERKAAAREVIGARAAGEPRKREERIADDDRRLLAAVARDAIRARLEGREYAPPAPESLAMQKGAFVTLHLQGQLRGCIGRLRSDEPLPRTIADMAVAAAFEDPRFPELHERELDRIDIEISILSPLARVRDIEEIQVGRDGLMIKLDWHSGLLLPQVAAENGWDRMEFLGQTCLKAGLPKSSWKDKNAEIYRFSAEVF